MMVVALLTISADVGAASQADRPIPDEEYFGLVLLSRDEEGVEVPIRNGDSTLGFAKACWKHNFCSLNLIAATIQGSGDKQPPEGSRVVYLGHVVGDGHDLVLRVVVDTSVTTNRGAPPDGRSVGLITAYCEGMPRCPDAVNQT